MGKNNYLAFREQDPYSQTETQCEHSFMKTNARNNKLYLTENKALNSFLSKQEP